MGFCYRGNYLLLVVYMIESHQITFGSLGLGGLPLFFLGVPSELSWGVPGVLLRWDSGTFSSISRLRSASDRLRGVPCLDLGVLGADFFRSANATSSELSDSDSLLESLLMLELELLATAAFFVGDFWGDFLGVCFF